MRKYLIVFAIATLSAACGDDESTADAAITSDAMPTPDAPVVPGTCTCLALGVDYTNGVGIASAIQLPSMAVTEDVIPGGVSSDPVVRYLDGIVFVVNRFGADNITMVDPNGWVVTEQFSTGAGSNPQDIALRGTTGYVVALGEPEVQIWDLTDPAAGPTGAIPLPVSALDVDGNPDAASIVIVGTRAYVTLQHLENFAPAGPGTIVVIDLMTNTVEQSVELTEANPVNFVRVRADGDLLVAMVPDFTPANGCLETFDSGFTPAANGCLVTSAALGGYIAGVAPGDDGYIYLATQSSFTESKLVRVADDGTVDDVPFSATGQLPTDVAYCGAAGQIVANDMNAGGLRVYNTTTHAELTTQPIDIGLPPGFANGLACW